MGATRALAGDASGHAIDATSAGALEADRRITDPLRKFRVWDKVGVRHMLPRLTVVCCTSSDISITRNFSAQRCCQGFLHAGCMLRCCPVVRLVRQGSPCMR